MIATKFPSYLIDHPNKVVWLVHQFRQAYELDGTEHGQLSETRFDRAIRERIAAADQFALERARKIFATSPNVAGRLQRSTGLEAEVLPHPPQELDYRCDRYDPFVLSVGRLDPLKRIDLLLEAAAIEPRLRVVVAGDGPDRGAARGARRAASATGCASPGGSTRRSWPTCTRPAGPSTTRRSTRTSGWCRSRRTARASRS